jgi:hypothetical protein
MKVLNYYIAWVMRVGKFEEIIGSSVVRLRGALEGEELMAFEGQLSTQ